jgi:hypothetical protein
VNVCRSFSVSRVTWDSHKSLSEQLDSWLRKAYSSGELALAQKQKTANDDDLSAALRAQKDLERQVTEHHRYDLNRDCSPLKKESRKSHFEIKSLHHA